MLRKLKFTKDLGKLKSSEVLEHVQELHDKLAALVVDQTDLKSLDKIRQPLLEAKFLNNKAPGVRAYTACCLVDLLRLHAPNAPYTSPQLQTLFRFLFKEIHSMSQPDFPYAKQYHYILEQMVETECHALVLDLPKGDELLTEAFKMLYDAVASRELMENSQYLITRILCQFVENADALPTDVTKLILSHLVAPEPDTKTPSNVVLDVKSRAFNISRTICIDYATIMTRMVNQYVSEILNPIILADDHQDAGTKDEIQKQVDKIGNILVALWKTAPDLLVNLLGQLEQNMAMENSILRIMATRTVGIMVGHEPTWVNFVTEYPTVYKAWLGRRHDINWQVRTAWLSSVPAIVRNRYDIVADVLPPFLELSEDAHGDVRVATCVATASIDVQNIVLKAAQQAGIAQPLLPLANRLRDKRPNVRAEAFTAICQLYDEAYPQIAAQDVDFVNVFGWIPARVLELLYVNDKVINEQLDFALFEHLCPWDDADNTSRTTRLLVVLKCLDEKPLQAYHAIIQRQIQLASFIQKFLATFKQATNGKASDAKAKISSHIEWLATPFPDKAKATKDLSKVLLDSKSSRQFCRLLGTCTNLESDYKAVHKAIKELINITPADAKPTVKLLLYRASYILLNKSSVSTIIALGRDSSSLLREPAHLLLKQLAARHPAALKSQATDLISIIETGKPGFDGSAETLKAACQLLQRFPDLVPENREFWESVFVFATKGSIFEVKQATKLLKSASKSDMYQHRIVARVQEAVEGPPEELPSNFSSLLAAVAQLLLDAPETAEELMGPLTACLIRHVLLSNKFVKASDDDPEWLDDRQLHVTNTESDGTIVSTNEQCLRKLVALRVLVNRLRSLADVELAAEVSKPILKALNSLIVHGGELSQKLNDTPSHYKSRLRLEACLQVLKLAELEFYQELLGPAEINNLVLLIQDPCLPVRQGFLHKLTRCLSSHVIPSKMLPLVYFTACDPNAELKEFAVTWIRARFSRQTQPIGSSELSKEPNTEMERSFARFLHILSHFESGDGEDDEAENKLVRATRYIGFYLNLIATRSNVSLVFYMAQRLKQYRDATSEDSTSMYRVSDLAELCVKQLGSSRGWPIETFPGKINLSGELFRPLQSTEEAREVASKAYIPESLTPQLEEFSRKLLQSTRIKTENEIQPKKRLSGGEEARATKKAKRYGKAKKPEKRTRAVESAEPVRQSSRVRAAVNYGADGVSDGEEEEEEPSDDEDDEEDF